MHSEPKRLPQLLAGATRPVISFELFPPKNEAAMANLNEILPELAAMAPDYMTVTYGALGSTRDKTLDIATRVQNQFAVPTACHLTCVGSTRADLDQILGQIHQGGIRNIVALRGDPPKGEITFTPPVDGLGHANELVAHIRQAETRLGVGPFGIAVAGYPEKHMEASSLEEDLLNLKKKVDAGADCVVTQLFYDNQAYFNFVTAARRLGITVPIIPGLLPIISAKQVVRIASMCGAAIPDGLKADLEAAGDDAAQSEDLGVAQCLQQARELLAAGAPGIHFYVLNRSSHMGRIMKDLRPV